MSERESSKDVAQDMLAAREGDWPDPQPLPDELPPVLPFDYDLLPSTVQPWTRDIAARLQCPPDFPAAATMVSFASLVSRKVAIRPKRHNDWTVVPNLFGMVVGPPSVLKTPAMQEPLKPLKRFEIEAKAVYEKELETYEAERMVAEQRRHNAKQGIRKALAKHTDEALAIAQSVVEEEADQPIRRRYLVNDPTVEKLGEILNENPNGVLLYRDELIGLLRSLEKEGQEGARAFYLEAWDGKGRYTYDRIGRGTVDIEAAIVSVIGSIQPGPLRAYLRAAVSNDKGADGLMQRFQLAVYPDVPMEWKNIDRYPDGAARAAAYEVYCRLDQASATDWGATRDQNDPDGIPYLRFDAAAQPMFDAWHTDLELHLRSGREHDVMVQHLAKYRSLIPSLALLIHLAEGGVGPVTAEALRRAIGWGKYLESHARRIYAIAIAPDSAGAIALGRKLLTGALRDGFGLRDVYRHGWIDLATRDLAAGAVQILIDLDWLAEEHIEDTGGRPRTRYRVNPRIAQFRNKSTDKTAESPLLSVLSAAPAVLAEKSEPDEAADEGVA